jgi:hypothetical protein
MCLVFCNTGYPFGLQNLLFANYDAAFNAHCCLIFTAKTIRKSFQAGC